MKLLRNYVFQAALFLLAVVGMQSCSCNDKHESVADKIEYAIPGDCSIVFAGDINRLLSATEIKVSGDEVELPAYLKDFMNSVVRSERQRKEIQEGLDVLKVIDCTNCVGGIRFISSDDVEALIMFNVEDEDEFADAIGELNSSFERGEEDGYVTVGNEYAKFCLKDGNCFFVATSDKGGAEVIEKWAEAAKKNPLASWQKDYLVQARIFGMVLDFKNIVKVMPAQAVEQMKQQMGTYGLDQLLDGTVTMGFDLDGETAKVEMAIAGADGKPMESVMNGKFNGALLDYTTPDDVLAFGWAMSGKGYEMALQGIRNAKEEMNKYQGLISYDPNMRMVMELLEAEDQILPVAKEYLADGGLMVAAGVKADADIINMVMGKVVDINDFHAVVALDCKPGKAAEAFDFLVDKLQENPLCTINRDGNEAQGKVQFADSDVTYVKGVGLKAVANVYVKVDGNVLVISNQPIVKGSGNNFSKDVFSGSMTTLQLKVDKDFAPIRAFAFKAGIDILLTSDGSMAKAEATFTGKEGKFIPTLFDIISGN